MRISQVRKWRKEELQIKVSRSGKSQNFISSLGKLIFSGKVRKIEIIWYS